MTGYLRRGREHTQGRLCEDGVKDFSYTTKNKGKTRDAGKASLRFFPRGFRGSMAMLTP